MDATCAIQNSIHVFSLVHINMCPEFWVHISFFKLPGVFILKYARKAASGRFAVLSL